MKIKSNQTNTEHSGNLSEKKFSIKASAHAFEILSSRLYTDVIRAIIRELSTNAADSHIEAGKPYKPFYVHLPKDREPWFEIRDYGTGLSRSEMIHTYTTYFDSTRNASNDFTGALGLGSKSPLAYTDLFTVVSYFKGEASTYSVFRSKEGEPSITHLSSIESDEPNGLKIKIPVKTRDIYTFIDRASTIYEYFDIRPETNIELDHNDKEPDLHGVGWKIYGGGFFSSCKLVMGNVCYDVNIDKFLHNLNNCELILKAPIGTCNFAASREELHYDEETCNYLQNLLDRVKSETQTLVQNEISSGKSEFERKVIGSKYARLLKINGITGNIKLNEKDKYISSNIYCNHDRISIKLTDEWQTISPARKESYLFIENDLEEIKQKHRNALRYWLNSNSYNKKSIHLFKIEDREHFKATFGNPAIRLSQIPMAPRRQGNYNSGGQRYYIKRLTPRRSLTNSWTSVEEKDVNTSGVAVCRDNYKVIIGGKQKSITEVKRIATAFGFVEVYGLPKRSYNKLCRKLGLQDFETAIKGKIESLIHNGSAIDHAALIYARNHKDINDRLQKLLKKEDGVCQKTLEFFNKKKESEWLTACGWFGIDLPKVEDPTKQFYETYPFLEHINWWDAKDSLNAEILKYVRWKNTNS